MQNIRNRFENQGKYETGKFNQLPRYSLSFEDGMFLYLKKNLSLHPIDIFWLKLAFLVLKNKLFRCLKSIFVTSLSSPFVKGHGS